MQYIGSKNKIAKYLIPILEKHEAQFYIEPFCGGCNLIDKINPTKYTRIANDSNHYLIAMLKKLQSGWIPPSIVSKEMYYDIKNNPQNYPEEIICFVALFCSFGCKWWGGYASNKEGRNYADTTRKSLLKQIKNLENVNFSSLDYKYLKIPKNSIVYCDPPYQNTVKYKDDFNHEEFWQWCRTTSKNCTALYVSEYEAPTDFKCILDIKVTSTLNKNLKDSKIEKLFLYNP